MIIKNIELINNALTQYQDIVRKCEEIINENLEKNGGTLKQLDIFEQNLEFTNLIVAYNGDELVDFA